MNKTINIEEVQPLYNASTVRVLKAHRLSSTEVLVLYRSSELKYFKNGRANMHVAVTYSVEVIIGANEFEGTRGVGYWIGSKAAATKLFNATVRGAR